MPLVFIGIICVSTFLCGYMQKDTVPAQEIKTQQVVKTYRPNIIKLMRGDNDWVDSYTTVITKEKD